MGGHNYKKMELGFCPAPRFFGSWISYIMNKEIKKMLFYYLWRDQGEFRKYEANKRIQKK